MQIVIANGNREAAYVISSFQEDKRNHILVINSDPEVADYLTSHLGVSVYVGNPWRMYVLEECNVYDADLFISLSEKDTDNYAACLLAKQAFNVKKCICVVSNPANVDLYKKLGIDSVISSTYLLTQNIKNESGEGALVRSMNLDSENIVMVEATLLSKYRICGRAIKDIGFPSYANIAYIVRQGNFIIPKGNVVLCRHDSLVISCAKENEKDLTRYLTMRAGKKDIQERVLSQIKQTYQNRQQSLQTVKEEEEQTSLSSSPENPVVKEPVSSATKEEKNSASKNVTTPKKKKTTNKGGTKPALESSSSLSEKPSKQVK
ncbi:MAG: TrkA family potassium uptake protein [Erysipelotrichaceae bacterium]|nr:TrkA family potassium uptake protein [Erysipelotrichaceae bacterium]